MLVSKKLLLSGIATALVTPAFAEDRSTEKQKEQYLYQQSQDNDLSKDAAGAIGATQPSSGPGVQGPPDTRTGPATKIPDSAASSEDSDSASSGASTGEAGQGEPMDNSTQPSQDSSGVQGFPDTRTGPSTKNADDASQGVESSPQ